MQDVEQGTPCEMRKHESEPSWFMRRQGSMEGMMRKGKADMAAGLALLQTKQQTKLLVSTTSNVER